MSIAAFGPANALNNQSRASLANTDNRFIIENTSNTANAHAQLLIQSAGGSAGDPKLIFSVAGLETWTVGVDNSVSDNFVISNSGGPGTSNVIDIAASNLTTSFVAADVQVRRANAGNDVTLSIMNLGTTASSDAVCRAEVTSATGGDAIFQAGFFLAAATWTFGMDNSDGDAYALAASDTLGTTNVMRVATTGEVNFPLTPAFSAYQASVATDVTGDGTVYTLGSTVDLTEIFDQNADFDPATGTFTAPVTGRYQLNAMVQLLAPTSMLSVVIQIVSSNRTYKRTYASSAALTQTNQPISILADMDAADTATCTIQATEPGGKVVDVSGTDAETIFSGYLAC